MKRAGYTTPFRDPEGRVLPRSISEVHYLKLGGLEQWVMVRGADRDNPVLIMLHGGPGMTEMPLLRHFNDKLEESFTVVYWDQRGAGKSFSRRVPRSSMTLEQFIRDLDGLADWVRERLMKEKVTLFGHSWGSVFGLMYAARFPEKVGVYVGGAQVGDWVAGEAASYAYALSEAQRRDNQKALRMLRKMGPPPHSAANLFKERSLIQRMEGQLTPSLLWKMARMFAAGPERSILDLPPVFRGFRFTLNCMWPELSAFNLRDHVTGLNMPAYFFLGRKDHWVPPEVSLAFIDALTAPSKEVVWFEDSGHEMFADEPERFNAKMVELVRPAALASERMVLVG